MLKSYRDLQVWQKAMLMAREIYRVTAEFPREELYGLTQQIRRAAVSIPSNIAEGEGRESTKEWLRHLSIARGSLYELETQLLLAKDLSYVTEAPVALLMEGADEISRMLRGLQSSLKKRLAK